MSETWKFETLSVHAGYSPDPTTRAALEGGIAALAVASGQAAVAYAIQTIPATTSSRRRRCTAAPTTCWRTRCRCRASRRALPTTATRPVSV